MRIRIAAVVTASFIAALSAAGIAVRADHHGGSHPQSAVATPTVSAPAASAPAEDDFEEFDDE